MSDDDGLNPTPEKRSCKNIRPPARKRVAKVLSLESPVKGPAKRPREPTAGFGQKLPSRREAASEGASQKPPPESGSEAPDVYEDAPDFFDPGDFTFEGGRGIRYASAPADQADKRHAEEENWAEIRPGLKQAYVESLQRRESLMLAHLQDSRRSLQEVVKLAPLECSHCKATTASFLQTSEQPVLYIDQAQRFLLSIPLFACSACSKLSHAHPLSTHAFPGTPIWGFQLDKGRGSQGVPTWYSLDLLELYDSLTFNGKRGVVSLESFCSAIEGLHEKHGITEPALSLDSFRKGFGKAWEEIGYIWHAVSEPGSFGVDGFKP